MRRRFMDRISGVGAGTVIRAVARVVGRVCAEAVTGAVARVTGVTRVTGAVTGVTGAVARVTGIAENCC